MSKVISVVNQKGGVGKCVAPDTPVLLSSGRIATIEEVWQEHSQNYTQAKEEEEGKFIKPEEKISVLSLSEDLELVEKEVDWLYQGEAEKLFDVTTKRGKRVEVTSDHPFLVMSEGEMEWKPAGEIEEGDFVATPRGFDIEGTKESIIDYLPECSEINSNLKIDKDLAFFLAFVFAEGYITPSRIIVHNQSERLLARFIDYCERLGLECNKERLDNQWKITVNTAGTLMHILQKVFSAPIKEQQKSFKIKIPDLILQAPEEILAEYLGTYISAEGYIAKDRTTLEVSTASKENAIDIHYALLRFGIQSSIKAKQSQATNSDNPKLRTYWRITITGVESLQKVLDNFPIVIKEKKEKLQQILELEGNGNLDVVPVEKLLRNAREQLDLCQKDIGDQGSISDYERRRSHPSRSALQTVSKTLLKKAKNELKTEKYDYSQQLRHLSQSDIVWEKVDNITTRDYNGKVYDLTVEDNHNFVAGKGGIIAHNTTTAMNLSASLAEKGKFVLLVDLDPQANASSGLGLETNKIDKGLYEALTDQHQLKDIVYNNQDHEGLRIAPATENLAGANVEFVELDRREFQLSDLLEEAKHAYDYILIDCPPALGLLTVNGMVASDEILVPVQAEYYALEGLGQLFNSINLVQEHIKSDLDILGAVLTMLDKRTNLSGEVREELYDHFPEKVFDAEIPRSIRLAEAPSYGKSILEYEPSSRGAKAYEKLAEEILETHNNQ